MMRQFHKAVFFVHFFSHQHHVFNSLWFVSEVKSLDANDEYISDEEHNENGEACSTSGLIGFLSSVIQPKLCIVKGNGFELIAKSFTRILLFRHDSY